MEIEEQRKKWIKWIIIGVLSLLILWFILSLFSFKKEEKQKTSKYIREKTTYTIPGTSITSRLPYVVLKGSHTKEVNQELEELYNRVVAEKNSQFTYQYSLNDSYLSLAVIINRLNDEGYPYPSFETYNFDLKTGAVLKDADLLNSFGKTMNQVALSFEEEMKTYYQQELDQYYLTELECDYHCFLKYRNVESYQDDLHLFVDENKLKFYRGFMVYSNIGEEDFYQKEDFLFEVK